MVEKVARTHEIERNDLNELLALIARDTVCVATQWNLLWIGLSAGND